MKKKKTLINALMVAGTATMGVGLSTSSDVQANVVETSDDVKWICCQSWSTGCTDRMGYHYPVDYTYWGGPFCPGGC